MTTPVDPIRTGLLLDALTTYRAARQALLAALGPTASNRDPLTELAEHLVQALLGGALAASRVQADYDLVLDDASRVQVRCLTNPGGTWVNEHLVDRVDGVDLYALVLFESFTVVGVLVFPTRGLAAIGAALGKRHLRQDETLQFTRRNFHAIRDDPDRFRGLGVRVWLPGQTVS
ncbi:hypothetical protein I6A60_11355 [Frankia sp. AgB1.9]|uniref:hypothetical protein n=1 Tax=unclassified Frankia TaxID=2632575 RepID=UPI0019333A4A|nr:MULTISPECIES: hypothetical protein [unclassified Frankia]MBL7490355.1 hypothetical protein [Frankia sp. AgW1.1]MBL7548465.1 hypothetical protein [Frankia sp. AgB1.9]MBL7621355.1 hypothetical protein [Frankia sp. AgB1.8]